MFEPIGPLPPEIYWRRRAVAIGVIVILVVALIWLVSSLRGGGETPEADNAVSTSDLTLPAPSSSSSASTSKSAAPQSGTSTTPTGVSGGANVGQPADTSKPTAPPAPGGAPGQCPDQSLAVKATVENPTYKVGQKPVFGIVITNISTTSCQRDLGAGLQQVLVFTLDGVNRIWSNTDCYPNSNADMRTLGPGQQAAFSVEWSGTNSTPGCQGERTPVQPGAYMVVAQLGSLRSAPEPFNIA